MRFVRIETDDEDTRWINLSQVSRATVGKDENSVPTLILMFADGNIDNSLKVVGHSDENRQAIDTITTALDAHLC